MLVVTYHSSCWMKRDNEVRRYVVVTVGFRPNTPVLPKVTIGLETRRTRLDLSLSRICSKWYTINSVESRVRPHLGICFSLSWLSLSEFRDMGFSVVCLNRLLRSSKCQTSNSGTSFINLVMSIFFSLRVFQHIYFV